MSPGITGWAQVSGKNDISWKQKFELDLFYVNHLSFKLDLKILVKTIILLITFKKDTSLTERKNLPDEPERYSYNRRRRFR